MKRESDDFLYNREKIPHLMNWCLENMLPEDLDANLL